MGEGSGLNVAVGRRHRWASDRVIGLLRPGNAGGGKDPDFWCAFEDGEEEGDWPCASKHPVKLRSLPRKLYRGAKAKWRYG